ncbi:MAG TPA: UDP-N-acetylmuramate dehydrogenase [Vicinamibacteria bacterium]|nr:UDP-N-acetylmuramate dehydrogenase [Vicinamibacteria bacterium]
MDLAHGLRAELGADRVRRHVPLDRFTTFRIGGPADLLAEVRAPDEALAALRLAREAGVPVTWLGGGSNVLIGDGGIRGLVVRWHGGAVEAIAPDRIRADAGVTLNGLVRHSIAHGRAGLAEWAGTPGTVGGAVHGNAHFRGRLISERVASVEVAAADGAVREVDAAEMGFAYDRSRLQRSGELALRVVFRVGRGDPDAQRGIARASLAFRKRTQPLALASAGCVFRNPDPDRARLAPGIPCSAGALVDLAGMKGEACGGARVSTVHANFVVNEGGASAREVATLVERMRDAVAARFGVVLEEEIVRLGEFA